MILLALVAVVLVFAVRAVPNRKVLVTLTTGESFRARSRRWPGPLVLTSVQTVADAPAPVDGRLVVPWRLIQYVQVL